MHTHTRGAHALLQRAEGIFCGHLRGARACGTGENGARAVRNREKEGTRQRETERQRERQTEIGRDQDRTRETERRVKVHNDEQMRGPLRPHTINGDRKKRAGFMQHQETNMNRKSSRKRERQTDSRK